MSLQVVVGKPGSGKSYHVVTLLLQLLSDWSEFERREGRPFDRVLYTNLPLRSEVINAYLKKQSGKETEISHYIHPIDADVKRRFSECGGACPLSVLPQNALIAIDEVQNLFGAEIGSGRSKDPFFVSFRNYVSEHRHYGHDLIFITQDVSNIAAPILAMAEKLSLIDNIKNRSLAFPINIPLSDLEVVKEAFGIKNQFYMVSVGRLVRTRVYFDGEFTRHLMLQEIFACYSSHTLSDISSDRPSLRLSRFGALFWLAKKHFWHLSIKTSIALSAVYFGYNILIDLPNTFTKAFQSSIERGAAGLNPQAKTSTNDKLKEKKTSLEVKNVSKENKAVSSPPLAQDFFSAAGIQRQENVLKPVEVPPSPALPEKLQDDKILALYSSGMITNNGRRMINDTIVVDGEKEIIESINVRSGMILFSSGKKVLTPQ